MFGAQTGNPPPWHNQGVNRNGPPPAKKVKGNPIITRYPPPPGYQGPAQQQGAFQHQQWQQPNHAYNYAQQGYPGYPPQAYGQAQHHAQHQWHAYDQQQANGWPPGYYQQYAGWPPSHQPGWQAQASPNPQSAPPQTWQTPINCLEEKQRHHSEAFANSNPEYDGPVDGIGDPLPPESPRSDTGHDLEDDYDGECYFLRHPDEINPDLSLGELEWRPARRVRLALPSTMKEFQLEIIAPRKTPPPGEDCVSEYFFRDKREETLLTVRLTDEWRLVKDDIIFREFEKPCQSILTRKEIMKKYKDRRDRAWREQSATPEPTAQPSYGISQNTTARVNEAAYGADQDASSQAAASEDGDVLGNLEQAVQRNTASRAGRHSRANSATSITSNHSTKLKPLMPVRDRAQDDVLRSLGVTGSPKMVYQTPGPAFGAPPPQREGSVSRDHSRQPSVASNSGAADGPPPPSARQPGHYTGRTSTQDSRHGDARPYGNGYDSSRRGSNASRPDSRASRQGPNARRPDSRGSQRTASGSDYERLDEDRTPRPRTYRTDSRKRDYDDYHGGDYYRGAAYDEDATPRQQRYKQQRVNDTYGRRW